MKDAFIFILALLWAAAGSQARAANRVVEMRNFSFVPNNLTVNQGDSVTWTNLDNVFHNTVSGEGGDPNGTWEGPLIGRGGSFTFMFDVAPGLYPYYCTPHVGLGMVGSITVQPRPLEGPAILTQPRNQSVFLGDPVSFAVVATGAAPLLYQWQFNAADIPGATNESYTLSAVSTNNAGSYSVTIRNAAGSVTSSLAVLTVLRETNAPPIVTLVQPVENSRITTGTPVDLEAQVTAPGGSATRVEFLVSGSPIGTSTTAPYTLQFVPQHTGELFLEALAVDEFGQRGTSAPVRIVIFAPENRPPKLRITRSPRNFSRLDTPVAILEGTAIDDVGIDRVEYQVNGGPFEAASGSTIWRAEVPLAPGNNIVLLRAIDWAGNQSLPIARYFVLPALSALHVNLIGAGKVTPDLNGKSLQAGTTYVLKAVPDPGFLFAGWSGGAVGNAPKLSFQMIPGLELTATFKPNPFTAVSGTYQGLFYPVEGPLPANSGAIRLRLTARGLFTGVLSLGGRTSRFTGQFNSAGQAQVAIMRPGLRPLVIEMQLDFASSAIQGTVTDGTWTSQLQAIRNDTSRAPAESLGKHLSVIMPLGSEDGPDASGIAVISPGGSVQVRGSTDGRAFSFSTTIGADGRSPFYASLDRRGQIILGWVEVCAGESLRLQGNLVWTKAEPDGFSTYVQLLYRGGIRN